MKPILEAAAYFAGVAALQKLYLQRRRRRVERAAELATWRCVVCGGPAPAVVLSLKRKTCSPGCRRVWRGRCQRRRRVGG